MTVFLVIPRLDAGSGYEKRRLTCALAPVEAPHKEGSI